MLIVAGARNLRRPLRRHIYSILWDGHLQLVFRRRRRRRRIAQSSRNERASERTNERAKYRVFISRRNVFASGWDSSDAAKHKVFHKPSYPTLRQILNMEEGKEGDERRDTCTRRRCAPCRTTRNRPSSEPALFVRSVQWSLWHI